MSETPELYPCPFCGGEARLVADEWEPDRFVHVACVACEAGTADAEDARTAIRAWNRRTAPCRCQLELDLPNPQRRVIRP